MELISGFFFVVVIGVISYVFTRKEAPVQSAENGIEVDTLKELERRQEIIEQVESFLLNASYLEHIGNFNREKVYKYISNEGRTYEFSDFMAENNQKIGIDDDWLCFKRMTYKRSDFTIVNI